MSGATAEPSVPYGPAYKVGPHHLERLAMIYVRQSHPQQIVRHPESTQLQYALTEHAEALGWGRDRIVVIDDDQGRSAKTAEGRMGFQQLVAEVGMSHVGIIVGIDMSRLARSCRDWYHLLEVCALFRTLICDPDGIYDPSNYNDRLLLGLKGTMSEAELHILKQRMSESRHAKARRGALSVPLPMGYLRRSSGEVVKDPDEQVQTVVKTIFEQFEIRGTSSGVLSYLVKHGIRLPVRERTGPGKGELSWRRPNRSTVQNVLKSPIYAGVYVYGYGYHPTDPRRPTPERPTTGRTADPREKWEVFLPDRLPTYISWEQYEANQTQLDANRAQNLGVTQRAASLLAGLLICGRCERRMSVSQSRGNRRYLCSQEMSTYGGDGCQSLSAQVLDRTVEELVLRALEPSALEVSLEVATNIEEEHKRIAKLWAQRLERAQYEVDRALRQYNAVEPEHRLVARTLERKLEEALAAQRKLQEEHHRAEADLSSALTAEERDAIRQLATDLPALWHAETTTVQQKQTIVRQLMERIQVTFVGKTERVQLVLEWAGSHTTSTEIMRPVRSVEQLSYYEDLMSRMRALHDEGKTNADIADQLNREERRPPKRSATFTRPMVQALLSRVGQAYPHASTPRWPLPRLQANEWTVSALANKLPMPVATLSSWIRKGWVTARKTTGKLSVWVVRADAAELERLRALPELLRTRQDPGRRNPSTS